MSLQHDLMPTMRNKGVIFGLAAVTLWATVTYFLIFRTPSDADGDDAVLAANKRQVSKQIDKLEQQIRELIESNEELIEKLKITGWHLKLDNETTTGKEPPETSTPQAHNNTLEGAQADDLDRLVSKKYLNNGSPVIPVLVISCNRVTVQRCLDQLLKYRTSEEQFPIVVSQDCEHTATTKVIKQYGSKIFHIQQPDQSDIDIPLREKKFKGYFKIARHYGWALNQMFFRYGFDSTIVVEDDLDVAPDFFEYFLGTHSILTADTSLWCVSAWNDNGKAELVDLNSPHLLHRTDFFPGLGWMLTRRLWQELGPKWPKSYWDDWIRQPEQRKNRSCIRPELPRTRTFGKIGVSNGMFYEKHLRFIKLNDQFVPFTEMNLTGLLKANYDPPFFREVNRSPIVTFAELKAGKIKNEGAVRIVYHNRQSYKMTAKMLGLMDDFKSGVPRTGYRGVVTFYYGGRRVYLAPGTSWSGYDPTWS